MTLLKSIVRKLIVDSGCSSTSQPTVSGVDLPEQHVTAPPDLPISAWVSGWRTDQFSVEFSMTITTKVEHLTTRQASLVATVLLVRSLSSGVDITTYLLLEYIYAFLTRNRETLEIVNEKHRKTALVLEAFLTLFRGSWITMGEKQNVPENVKQMMLNIEDWFPNERTWASWQTYWLPEKFFQVRIVPVEHLIERSGYSVRYSSYCKGYGDGGHVSRVKKTPYDYELDGESTDRDPPDFNLLDLEKYQALLLAIEAEKARRVQGNK